MRFLCEDKLKIAYDRPDEILRNVPFPAERMIDAGLIVEYVRMKYCPTIELYTMSFEKVQADNISMRDCGARMRIDFDASPKAASIIRNSDMPEAFQRFSLMQQIGHLVSLPPDVPVDRDSYPVSIRIGYDLAAITLEDRDSDSYLLREQVANIFALRVLMPDRQFTCVMRQIGNRQDTAAFFGLTEDAVISRMMIGA